MVSRRKDLSWQSWGPKHQALLSERQGRRCCASSSEGSRLGYRVMITKRDPNLQKHDIFKAN